MPMDINEIKSGLQSTKSKDRRRAAKEIGKSSVSELADLLHQAFLKEQKDKRTWETQLAMIDALGLIQHAAAVKDIESIVNTNLPHDRVTSAAATACVRLKRKSNEDASVVIDLLENGRFSVISGALMALALDQMHPPVAEIREILQRAWDLHQHEDRVGQEYALIDPRIYVALACWDWDKQEVEPFLQHCIETAHRISSDGEAVENTNLINVCHKSLAGKASKGYL